MSWLWRNRTQTVEWIWRRKEALGRRSRRAITDAEKEQVASELLALWKRHPELRLGQLMVNVYPDAYYAEDFDLIESPIAHYARQEDGISAHSSLLQKRRAR